MVPPKQIWTFQTVINKWEIGMLEASKKKKNKTLKGSKKLLIKKKKNHFTVPGYEGCKESNHKSRKRYR